VVPINEVCLKSKHWWTKELKGLRTSYRKLGRKIGRYKDWPEHKVHAEFREVHKKYDKAIKYNKHHHWRDWLEKALELDLWTASKYISAPASDGGKTRIPNLKQTENGQVKVAGTNSDKADMLTKVFFPSKLVGNMHDQHNDYPPPNLQTAQTNKRPNQMPNQMPKAIQSARARWHP